MDAVECCVISPQSPGVELAPRHPEDLVFDLCRHPSTTATLVEFHQRRKKTLPPSSTTTLSTAAVWALAVATPTTTSVLEALEELDDWLEDGGNDLTLLCRRELAEGDDATSFLLCFKRAEPSSTSLTSDSDLSSLDCEKQQTRSLLKLPKSVRTNGWTTQSRRSPRLCSTFTLIAAVLILLMLTTITTTIIYIGKPLALMPACPAIETINTKYIPGPDEKPYIDSTETPGGSVAPTPNPSVAAAAAASPQLSGEYFEFPTPPANTGPRHQKYLLPSNITSFSTTHNLTTEYTMRLDDQALVPTHLFEQHDLNVQQWFATNFPILESIYADNLHLTPPFLDYNGTHPQRLLLHERYHIAHCTTAFRRYLRALRKGRHLCPRDLDLGHLDHCTRQLESFAYRPREAWGSEFEAGLDQEDRFLRDDEEFDPYGMQVMLLWHTDVCY